MSVNRAPVITGAGGKSGDDHHNVKIFTNVTITEPDSNSQVETVRVVSNAAGHGAFTAASLLASGFTANLNNPGEYDFTGTAAAATTAIRLLDFQPTAHDVAPGQAEATNFTVTVVGGSAITNNNATNVTITALNDAPTTVAQTAAVMEQHAVSGNLMAGAADVDKTDAPHLYSVAGASGAPVSNAGPTLGSGGAGVAGNYGTLTFKADGSYTYTETATGLGNNAGTHTDVFTYQAIDNYGLTSTNTLTITITSKGFTTDSRAGAPVQIEGGSNNHYLVGGPGVTTFNYGSVTESTPAHQDLIANYDPSAGDVIDLSHLDAIPSTGAQDHFTLVGAFSRVAGQLVVQQAADASGYSHILGDIDGDGVADFQVAFHLIGVWDPTHLHLV
jgi:VCBS repeat-containing protein